MFQNTVTQTNNGFVQRNLAPVVNAIIKNVEVSINFGRPPRTTTLLTTFLFKESRLISENHVREFISRAVVEHME